MKVNCLLNRVEWIIDNNSAKGFFYCKFLFNFILINVYILDIFIIILSRHSSSTRLIDSITHLNKLLISYHSKLETFFITTLQSNLLLFYHRRRRSILGEFWHCLDRYAQHTIINSWTNNCSILSFSFLLFGNNNEDK